MSISLWPRGLQHTRLPCPSPTPRAYSNSCQLTWWCHPTISSSVVPFSSCLQSFPATESFQWVSSSPRVAKIMELQLQHQSFQWIFRIDFLAVQGMLKSLFNTAVQKHQFFGAQLSLWSNSYIHTWLLEALRDKPLHKIVKYFITYQLITT